jgi:acetyl-CoA acetyltransferase
MMARDVYVVGVGMAPFGQPDAAAADLGFEAGVAALDDAGIQFREVGYLYNGYISAGLLTGITLAKDLGLTGIPMTHVENASATGSCAFHEAVQVVAGGGVEVAMALGFDDLNRAAPSIGGRKPGIGQVILPAAFFAMWATRRMYEVGTTVETYAAIAAKNWNHARHNPFAQRRADHEVTVEEVLASRMVAYPHTSKMACAAGSGAAAAIVASREVAERLAGGRPLVKVAASQQESERYTDGHIFMGAVVGPGELTQSTAMAAYEEAGLGPAELDLAHVHDAFPIEELMYYELLGVCGPGEGDKLVAEGATSLGGRIPFSTDGGLLGRGHPGGPTGLAQIWDVTRQLRGEAGPLQVEGARTGLAHMMGAGAICVVHILQSSS